MHVLSRRVATVVAALSILGACSGGTEGRGAGSSEAPTPLTARVIRVVDGDTVVVAAHGAEETVRLIGVDTPETVKPNAPVDCYGPEASALTHALLPPGATVTLRRDREPRDDYGRLLAYVYRASDHLFVNLELAEQGAARPLSISPNTAAADLIADAARRARAADLGLWGACSG